MRSRRWWPTPPKPKLPELTAYDRTVLRQLKTGKKVASDIPKDTVDRLNRWRFVYVVSEASPNPNHFGAWVPHVRISETGLIELQLEDMKREPKTASGAG